MGLSSRGRGRQSGYWKIVVENAQESEAAHNQCRHRYPSTEWSVKAPAGIEDGVVR